MLLAVEIRQSKTASRPTIRRSRICVFTQPQMLPDQLVGVAVWRIRRQKEQAQFRTQRLHEGADFLRTMSRATIEIEKILRSAPLIRRLRNSMKTSAHLGTAQEKPAAADDDGDRRRERQQR